MCSFRGTSHFQKANSTEQHHWMLPQKQCSCLPSSAVPVMTFLPRDHGCDVLVQLTQMEVRALRAAVFFGSDFMYLDVAYHMESNIFSCIQSSSFHPMPRFLHVIKVEDDCLTLRWLFAVFSYNTSQVMKFCIQQVWFFFFKSSFKSKAAERKLITRR